VKVASFAVVRVCRETEDTMIRKATDEHFEEIFKIINDAAIAYKGVIPPDRWHEPYMTIGELRAQIGDGVDFHVTLIMMKSSASREFRTGWTWC
jgi:hypothetical protein